MKYEGRKIFVTFLDGHELIYYHKVDYPQQPKYYYMYKMEDIELKPRQLELVQGFFDNLVKFNFVRLTDVEA